MCLQNINDFQLNCQLSLDNLKINQRSYYNLPNSSRPQNANSGITLKTFTHVGDILQLRRFKRACASPQSQHSLYFSRTLRSFRFHCPAYSFSTSSIGVLRYKANTTSTYRVKRDILALPLPMYLDGGGGGGGMRERERERLHFQRKLGLR